MSLEHAPQVQLAWRPREARSPEDVAGRFADARADFEHEIYRQGRGEECARAWLDLIRKVVMRGPMPTRFDVTEHRGALVLVVRGKTWNRDAAPCTEFDLFGEGINVRLPRTVEVEAYYPLPDQPSADFLYYCAQKMWLHELAEWWEVDGKRPHDPHAR